MEPRGAVEEARWNPFSAAMPSEDSEIMAQLLGPFSYTNEQGQKDPSFGLSSMSWDSDHAADSYYSSSENVNSCSKLYYWSQGSDSSSSSSFFCRSSGYESYYLSETNADPAVNTSFASASYCMMGEQLVLPSLDAIPNPPFGSANETSSDNIGDSSLNLLEAVPPHVRMSLPKRKSYASEDDNPSDISKKKAKAKAPASVPKNAKKAQSRRPQKTTKSCDEEETNAASNGQSSGSRFSEADSQADQNGGSSTISGLPSLNLTGKKGAGRGSSTDPQSLYARKRRERINERLRILQNLVPNGTKVDISTMLEEAVQYVKFLQLQIKLLSSDELWMYAPIAYNGMNIGLDLKISPPQ